MFILHIYITVNRVCIPTTDCLKFESSNRLTYNLQKRLRKQPPQFLQLKLQLTKKA